MSSTLLYQAQNNHTALFESSFEQATAPVQWLVIAHDDSRLTHLLSSALAGQSAVVLHIPQNAWDFQRSDLAESVDWALQQGEIRNLVLVGISQAGDAARSAVIVPAESQAHASSGIGKLIAGVRNHVSRNHEAQSAFAEQVRCLTQIPAVRGRYSDGELNVCGLLYRPESGVFLAYDPSSGTFQPLCS